MVDLDPQSSLTLAACQGGIALSMADVLGDVQPGRAGMKDIIIELGPLLYLAPGDIGLSNTELGLITRLGRESALKKALGGIDQEFDICLIDTGPSLGMLTINALVASHAVLIPTLPTALDLRGIKLFLDSMNSVKKELNPGLSVLGVLVCQYDSRLNLHKEILQQLSISGLPLFPEVINRSVKVSQSAGLGESVKSGPVFEQYKSISERINRWLNK